MSVIAFDTEATDLVPGQICQLSYLLVDGGEVRGVNMFFTMNTPTQNRKKHALSRPATVTSLSLVFVHCGANPISCDDLKATPLASIVQLISVVQ